jgi:hypothetical protein
MGLGILCVPVLSCVLATAPAAGAPADMPAEAQNLYKACLSDATSHKSIIQTADHSVYTCWGKPAEDYFDYLGKANAAQTIDKQPTGTYVFRAIPQGGRCFNKLHHDEEESTSYFGCSINIAGMQK